MKKNFLFTTKVWRWPGNTGWHFVNVPKDISKKIRTAYPKGFVSITAQIGKTSWNTALFPHKQSDAYLLSVKALVRKKEDVFEGDTISVRFKIL